MSLNLEDNYQMKNKKLFNGNKFWKEKRSKN